LSSYPTTSGSTDTKFSFFFINGRVNTFHLLFRPIGSGLKLCLSLICRRPSLFSFHYEPLSSRVSRYEPLLIVCFSFLGASRRRTLFVPPGSVHCFPSLSRFVGSFFPPPPLHSPCSSLFLSASLSAVWLEPKSPWYVLKAH